MDSAQFYKDQLQKSQLLIASAQKTVRTFMFVRLLVFLMVLIGLYFSWGNPFVFIAVFVVGLTVFLTAVNRFVDAKVALEKAFMLKTINEQELSVLAGDWSMMDAGLELIDPKHAFSFDLDLFSTKGVFGFMNRTFSAKGKRLLADQLLNGVDHPQQVNEMIEVLSTQIAWSQQFRVAGSIESRKKISDTAIEPLTQLTAGLTTFEKMAKWLIPITSISAIVLYNLDVIGSFVLTIFLILPLIIVGRKLKATNVLAEQLAKFEEKIKTMKEQIISLQAIATEDAAILSIIDGMNQSAVDALNQWLKIQQRFQVRMNIVVGIPMNILTVWDIRCRHDWSVWVTNHGDKLLTWETKLAELEVLISGATLRFNHPQTTYAQFHKSHEINVEMLQHPLIQPNKVVPNNVEFNEATQFMILTGPNMAGKSTYLRSLGLLFVLANAGFPIFAKHGILPKMKLFTSMRTADDLSQESSYFHAELTRLQFIMNALTQQEKVFVLLDEILKGTNSKDKEEGSKKFLKKLQRLNAFGVIATHDLALCQLAVESTAFVNKCFDSTIENDTLTFDYRLRDGICQNMNASFLLRKMNLVDE